MSSAHEWVSELFAEANANNQGYDSDRRLDYALRLLATSSHDNQEVLELELVDTYKEFDDYDWAQLFTSLKLNQLRVVDFYAPSQREISRWIRLIAFNEYR